MAQPLDTPDAAIGACLNCRSLYLVTPGSANCLICGRPPDLTLPFVAAHPEPVEELLIDEEGVMPPPSTLLEEDYAAEDVPAAPAEEPALLADKVAEPVINLYTDIADYLAGTAPVELAELDGDFQEIGADPESAATAVGRLAAVRELIAQLAQPQEQPPSAPEEPVAPPPKTASFISRDEAIEHFIDLGYTREWAEEHVDALDRAATTREDRTTAVSP